MYATSFSVPLSTEHITCIKVSGTLCCALVGHLRLPQSTVARALLPTLRQELQLLEDIKEIEPLRRERETDVRVTCGA